jgi:hypothetical protein
MQISEITFCVPTYNRRDVVAATAAINLGICSRVPKTTLIYLDNSSTDGTAECLKNLILGHESQMSLLANETNIGLRGSLVRFIREMSRAERLLVFLSDEEVIYEPGLVLLWSAIESGEIVLNCNTHYVFNYVNRRGIDFPFRRHARTVKSWSQWEPFSFGYMTGFAATLDQETAQFLPVDEVVDGRNMYPHWAICGMRRLEVVVVGLALACEYSAGNRSHFANELGHQESHLTSRNVDEYCRYHSCHVHGVAAALWRLRYRHCIGLLRATHGVRRGIFAVYHAAVLCLIWPRMLAYYAQRARR